MKKWFEKATDYQVRVVVAAGIAMLGFTIWAINGYFANKDCGAECIREYSSQRR